MCAEGRVEVEERIARAHAEVSPKRARYASS
jgi:hypothetical protein